MNAVLENRSEPDLAIDKIAAELTEVAFPVALEHGVGDDWLDYRLELWNALQGAVAELVQR